LLAQCAEKAVNFNPGFIGVWSGSSNNCTYRLSIDSHSNAYWVKDNNGSYTSAQGVARVEENELHIGLRVFQINQYPALDTATHHWSMILAGVTYTR